MIKIGNTDIEKVYLGSNEINKAYLGNQVIFDNTAVNPFADATVAFSLRDLGLGASHVVRVRRSSDNAEQDFTATEITDGSLLSFVGSGNGFVSVWYDQLGNLNASQTSANSQPKIVDNGSLILVNGKPAISSDGQDNILQATSFGISGTIDREIYSVIKSNISGDQNYFFGIGDGTGNVETPAKHYNLSTEFALRVQGGNSIYGASTQNQVLLSFLSYGDTVFDTDFRLNSITQIRSTGNDNLISTSNITNTIGGRVVSSLQSFDGFYQEFIVFAKNNNLQQQNIGNNINNYYGIY